FAPVADGQPVEVDAVLAKELLGRDARGSGRLPEERHTLHRSSLVAGGLECKIAALERVARPVTADLGLRNARLVYDNGRIVDGGLVCEDGAVAAIFEGDPPAGLGSVEEIDAGGRYVLPGLIDPHVQLYATERFGHYATETRSAAIGGVTTIIKMHRDLAGYEAPSVLDEIAGAENRAHVDFAFHLAVMTDDQIAAIPEYARELGVESFKFFTAYKGEEGAPLGIQGLDD